MDKFSFLKSFYDSTRTLTPEQRDMLYLAIFDYLFDDDDVDLESVRAIMRGLLKINMEY